MAKDENKRRVVRNSVAIVESVKTPSRRLFSKIATLSSLFSTPTMAKDENKRYGTA